MFPAKVIRNQSKLFEGRFEIIDDVLGDDLRARSIENGSDTFISSLTPPLLVHVEYRTSTTALHGQANRAPRLSQANALVPE
jgi:hypothetical protein